MKIDSSNIYAQNLAGLNSAKAIKEKHENFDVILENELKTKTIKAEDIKTSSDLGGYLMDKARKEFGHEKGVGVWSLSLAAAVNLAIMSASKDNPELDSSDMIDAARNKLAGNYESTDDLKQDIINRISLIQSDILYVPGLKSKAEYEEQKQNTINTLTEIYKELFNEEPVVPKFETLVGEGAGSSIDISAAIKEFLNKPFENEEEDELIELIKELYKEKQEGKEEKSEIQEIKLKDTNLKESFDIEKLALKERFTKEKQSIENFSLSLLLQSL